ncbi:hypothetical protein DXG03_001463 [Asterophora parasitica]|uniref:Uncharacterized protein n=1 Tax=Asterophora parasitica TaxID=117018 RepID=A0A9P7GBM9_9AGAR|nr:hypothetical protein DXG03_001463 [Asterophora parasitica]
MVANAGAGSPDIGSVILQSQYSHRSQPATPPPPPTLKDARYVRRETTRHVNDAVIMRAELGEIKDILEHTVSIHRNAMAEYREMSVLRREVEISIFQRMKNERDLWDGTGNMAEQDREPWEQLLKESEEFKVERKKEARRKEFEEWMAKEGANRENEARQVRLAAQAREATDDTPEGSTGSKRKRPVAVDEEE